MPDGVAVLPQGPGQQQPAPNPQAEDLIRQAYNQPLSQGGSSAPADPESLIRAAYGQAQAPVTQDHGEPTYGSVFRDMLPQEGEGYLHAAGRDIAGLAKGFVKPFGTLGEAYLYQAAGGGVTAPGEGGDYLKIPFTDINIPNPTMKEALLAAPQAAVTALGGPLEGLAKTGAEKLGFGILGRVAAHGAVGAGVGALSDLEHPVLGAEVGATFGGALGGLVGPKVEGTKIAPETPFTEPPNTVDLLNNISANFTDILSRARQGGVTFDPRTGAFNPEGFYVGLGNDAGVYSRGNANPISDITEMTPQALHDIVRQNPDLFQRNNTMLGVWQSDGKLYVEPSQQYSQIDPAFMAAVEKKQTALGGIIDGEYHEVPTAGPDALAVYNDAKQLGVAPTKVQAYHDALGQTTGEAQAANPVAEALERVGSAANAAARKGATAGVAGAGANAAGAAGGLPVLTREPQANGGVGGGDAPPAGGAPPPGGPQAPAGNVGDEGSRPGPSGFGFSTDEEAYLNHFLNLGKFELSGDLQPAILRANLLNAIRNQGLDPKARVTWTQTLAGARHIIDSMTPQELGNLGAKQVRENGSMTRYVSAAHTILARRMIGEIEGLMRGANDLSTQGRDASELAERANNVVNDQQKLFGNMVTSHSEYGRLLGSLRIAANQTTDPMYWLLKARRMRGAESPITADEQVEILGNLDKIKNASTAFERNRQIKLLAARVASMKYATPWQKGASFIRAELLSSPSSFIGAALGHGSYAAAFDATSHNLAGFYDMLVGTVSGGRTRAFAPLADFRARMRGAAQGVRDIPGLVKTGNSDVQGVVDQRELEWDRLGDQTTANAVERMGNVLLNHGNTLLGAYVKFITRAYGAIPHIIRAQALEASIDGQARVLAMGQKFGDMNLEARTAMIRQKWRATGMPEYVQRQAIEDAETAALTRRGLLARGATGLKKGVADWFGGPGELAASAALPFTTVPSNIIEAGVWHYNPFVQAPLAAAKLGKLFFQTLGPTERAGVQRAAVDHMARASIGAGAMLAGYLLAKAGRAQGPAANDNARQIGLMTGRQASSIRLGSEWYNDGRFAPITTAVDFGIFMHDMMANPHAQLFTDPQNQENKGVVQSATSTLAQSVADAPFAAGVKYISDLFTQPGATLGKYVDEVARGAVPTFIYHAELASDPYTREPDEKSGFLHGLLQTTESRIPILAEHLPVKPNPLGLPTTHETGVVAGFSPYPATQDQTLTDPVMKAISDNNVPLAAIKRERDESEDEYQRRIQFIAKYSYAAVNKMVTSPAWGEIDQTAYQMSQEPMFRGDTPAEIAQALRAKAITGVVGKIKAMAREATNPKAGIPSMLRSLVNLNDAQDDTTPDDQPQP